MMRIFVRIQLAAALAMSVAVSGVSAQAPAAPRPEQSYTLEDVLTSLRRAADTLNLARIDAPRSRALDSISTMLRAANATSASIDAIANFITGTHPSFADVARTNTQAREAWSQPWFYDALTGLRRVANAAGSGILPQVATKVDSATADHFIAPMDELETKILRNAQARNEEKLRRYEMKFGSESAQLNIVEVLVNYLVALPTWSPLAGSEKGPSPFELVTSYSTSGLTASQTADDKTRAHLVAGAYGGLRLYRFSEKRKGGNAPQKLLAPQYLAAGAFFMGAQDRPLISPLESGHRSGGFIDWGPVRAGLAVGQNWRAVIGVGKQILPYLF
jgi:hypothetical protein